MQIKLWFLVVLFSSLISCASTPKEIAKEKKDKNAASINVQLASGYMQKKEYQVAKEKLDKALRHDKTYVPAYITLAVLMTILNQPVEAENYYLEALDLDPKDPELNNNYGTFLCGIKKYKEAAVEFKKALNNQFYRTPEIVHANIGHCLMLGDNPDYVRAEKHLRIALKRRPNMASAMLGLAEIGVATKKYLMARAYSQRYHSFRAPTAESLWVQIQAEHALGDKKYFLEVSRKLLDNFPASKEADKLMKLPNL